MEVRRVSSCFKYSCFTVRTARTTYRQRAKDISFSYGERRKGLQGSRQDAIDAINNAFDRETLLTGFVRSIAVRAIRDMRSAQLEPSQVARDIADIIENEKDMRVIARSEIIRCKDCKHGSPNGKYGCKCYHYTLYETHEMKPDDFCSRAERRENERRKWQGLLQLQTLY